VAALLQALAAENPAAFDNDSDIVGGSVYDEGYALTYELTIVPINQIPKTVKLCKDKASDKVIVKDVKPCEEKPTVKPITTSLVTDPYGNLHYITNNQSEIRNSDDLQSVIKAIFHQKPQISALKPLST